MYFQNRKIRDTYLERLLAGLEPNKEEIVMKLSYFIRLMENETIRRILYLTFYTVYNKFSNYIFLLLLQLDTIIYCLKF